MNFKLTRSSTLLDLLRGTAAVLVLLEHWRNMLFVDYLQLETHRSLLAVPYVVSGAGHQAVVIFFILSGYLISGSIFRSLNTRKWGWGSYLTHRLVRLWVVLLPGLILCALWDLLAIHLKLAPGLYSGMVANHETPNVVMTLTLRNFLGNVFFLQTLVVPVFGSDQALWSLANEFWYYILFPLALLSLRKQVPKLERVLYIALFILIGWMVRGTILELFPVWLLGVILARLKPPPLSSKIRNSALLAYIPIVFAMAKFHSRYPILDDYVFAIVTFIALWILLSATSYEPQESRLGRFSRELSKFSYTLYVVHMPFCLFLTAIFVRDERWFPDIGNTMKGLAILAATTGYAYIVGLLTEAHTEKIRKWVEKKLNINVGLSPRHSNVKL